MAAVASHTAVVEDAADAAVHHVIHRRVDHRCSAVALW
eukprot:COSAG01_NODE_53401_length_339_cov_1.154167_1_plen_37_part_10